MTYAVSCLTKSFVLGLKMLDGDKVCTCVTERDLDLDRDRELKPPPPSLLFDVSLFSRSGVTSANDVDLKREDSFGGDRLLKNSTL